MPARSVYRTYYAWLHVLCQLPSSAVCSCSGLAGNACATAGMGGVVAEELFFFPRVLLSASLRVHRKSARLTWTARRSSCRLYVYTMWGAAVQVSRRCGVPLWAGRGFRVARLSENAAVNSSACLRPAPCLCPFAVGHRWPGALPYYHEQLLPRRARHHHRTWLWHVTWRENGLNRDICPCRTVAACRHRLAVLAWNGRFTLALHDFYCRGRLRCTTSPTATASTTSSSG